MPLSPRTLRPSSAFTPKSISGLALWLDASSTGDLYTTDAGPVTAVTDPRDIAGCLCWYDASDATSITKDGSNLVSQWNDKSGNLRHASTTGSTRPTFLANAQNGLSVIDFSGGIRQLLASGGFLQTPNITILAVVKQTGSVAGGGVYGGIISSCDFSYDASPRLVYHNGFWRMWGYGNFSDVTPQQNVAAILTGTVSAGASAIFRDGAQGDADAASGSLTTGSTATAIGTYRTNANQTWDGWIAEIIVYNSALSTADRARVEAYLAQRWGISGVHAQATATSDPVGYWRDRSGKGNNVSVATSTKRPLVGTQNSRKALTFDGSDDNLSLTPAAPVGSSGLTVVAAVKHNLSSQPFYLAPPFSLTVGNTSRPIERWQGGSSQSILTIGAVTNNVAGSYRSFADRFVYGLDALKDGVASGTHQVREFINGATNFDAANAGVWNASGQRINIGTRDDNGTQYKGDICELCIYDKRLTTSERRRLESYLATRWGITLAPQVSNADAQDWVNRVYANGGTVSASTASAVNAFCDAIDYGVNGASIRDRFYRLNLFCGGVSQTAVGLNACLVPLYRGPSLGGTQYGNTTDVLNASSTSLYNDTGTNGGLKGNGSTGWINTGLLQSAIPLTNIHLSASLKELETSFASERYIIGHYNAVQTDFSVLRQAVTTGNRDFMAGTFGGSAGISVAGSSSEDHVIGVRSGLSSAALYRAGSLVTSATGSVGSVTTTSQPYYVFARNNAGTADGATSARIRMYSIGTAMDANAALAFSNAVAAFNTAMGRV